MFPLVEFPQLVQHYAPHFRGVFSDQAFIQFQRYISGLLVSENKTVEGINRLFVHESRNQSSLNRLLTESPFAVENLNQARLSLLDTLPGTRIKREGVLSLDNTLLTHYGQHFDHIAYLFDPAQQCYVWAHDLVTVHYSDDVTDYPLLFRLWQPADLEKLEQGLVAAGIPLKESKQALKSTAPNKWRQYLLGVWQRRQNRPEVAALYDSKLRIDEQLLTQWVQAHPELRLPVTFDIWYTQPAFCRFLDRPLHLPYVGTLAAEEQVTLQSGRESLGHFAERLQQEHREAVKQGGSRCSSGSPFTTKGSASNITATARLTASTTMASTAWSSIIAEQIWQIARCSTLPTACAGRRLASPASAATAGPLKCIMKKAGPKGWISISCGTSGRLNGMSP